MNSQVLLYVCLFLAPIHFIFSAMLSKELFAYEQSPIKLIASTLLVWLLPILGPFLIYKLLGLKWFEAPVQDVVGAQSVVGGGLEELNAILNPKHRHVVEAKEKVAIELNLDGQLHNGKSQKELIEGIKKKNHIRRLRCDAP